MSRTSFDTERKTRHGVVIPLSASIEGKIIPTRPSSRKPTGFKGGIPREIEEYKRRLAQRQGEQIPSPTETPLPANFEEFVEPSISSRKVERVLKSGEKAPPSAFTSTSAREVEKKRILASRRKNNPSRGPGLQGARPGTKGFVPFPIAPSLRFDILHPANILPSPRVKKRKPTDQGLRTQVVEIPTYTKKRRTSKYATIAPRPSVAIPPSSPSSSTSSVSSGALSAPTSPVSSRFSQNQLAILKRSTHPTAPSRENFVDIYDMQDAYDTYDVQDEYNMQDTYDVQDAYNIHDNTYMSDDDY